ncbi:MAG: carbohydrate ABC transporter permease [Lachnospiraceae bacterium]|nr:carbohydrate ABC transporter permease [Lachnospiraceae bacterium]
MSRQKEKMMIKKAKTPKQKALKLCLYVFVILMALTILYPYLVMFTTALKSRAEIYAADGTVFPVVWLWNNFTDIWSKAPLLRYFLNSVIVAGGSTMIAILCGIPAAYALARMKFKGQKFFLGLVIVSQMFSPVVLLIGIYRVMSTLNMTDSLPGLIFINAAFNQAFAIWLLRGAFIAISPDMEQAARIDGCNKVQAMIRVLLPMAAPGIVTTLIFIFINAWNEYTIALTLISSDVNKPLTVGITIFNGYNMIEWQYLFAASLFATLPVIILFMCIEKHLVSGLASGGVKG